MKITQQLIAAASFASLLFAPLAQAQTSTPTTESAEGNTRLQVIDAGLSFSAEDLDFGSVAPHASTADNLVVTCTATAEGNATTTSNNALAVAVGDATCGEITVTGGTGSITYALTVEVHALTFSGNTISPTFNVFESNGETEVAGLQGVASGSTTTADDTRVIGPGVNHVYKLGGSATIAGGQALGIYTGTYIVSAQVTP